MRQFSTVDLLRDFRAVSRACEVAPVQITQHRKPAFVLMSAERYEALANRQDPRKVFSVSDIPEEDWAVLMPHFEKIIAEAGLDDQ